MDKKKTELRISLLVFFILFFLFALFTCFVLSVFFYSFVSFYLLIFSSASTNHQAAC